MPKETVISLVGPYDVKIGWRADAGLQVGIEESTGRSLFWMLSGIASRDTEPKQLRAAELGVMLREELGKQGFTVTGPPSLEVEAGRNEVDAHFARTVLNTLDVFSGAATPETPAGYNSVYSGVWSDLDRKGVNDLIRILRRARDSAFGRDE